MENDYFDYFVRVMDVIPSKVRKQKSKKILGMSPDQEIEKMINLFLDCFDHHTRCSDQPPVNGLNLLPPSDPRRHISRDSLFIRFLDHYYKPPIILKTPYLEDAFTTDQTLSFDELCSHIQTFPITADPKRSTKLGSNTYTYIVGDVGAGKTIFLSAIFRKIVFNGTSQPYKHRDEHDYVVIPIYINVDDRIEENGVLRQINEVWLNDIVDRIIDFIRASSELEESSGINEFNDPKSNGYAQRFRKLTQHLAIRKFRLLLLVDNVDRYHFHYSKYRFTNHHKNDQRNNVISNIKRLINALTSEAEIGYCGLCIVFVCRDYVYDYLRVGCSDLSQPEREFGRAHRIQLDDDYEVIRSRVALFEESVNLVIKHHRGPQGMEFLKALTSLLKIGEGGMKLRPEISLILRIGNHGYRSLIGFIGRLEVDLSNPDVFDRLLVKQTKNLPTLYILNMMQRYSQSEKHFPNLFLVDAIVSKVETFESAYGPHRPTYWLKYFILKVITKSGSIRLSQLQRVFCKIGNYEEKLVRLVIGSLCSTNDSRCIDVDAISEIDASADPDLLVTERGRQLVSHSETFSHSEIDFCFEFNYLQLIIDDVWLSLPKEWAEKVIVNLNYAYLFYPKELYGEPAWNMIRQKAYATSWFVAILSCALNAELKNKVQLKNHLSELGLLPDMVKIQNSLHATCKDFFRILNNPEEARKYEEFCVELPNHYEKMEQFFDTVYRKKVLVS